MTDSSKQDIPTVRIAPEIPVIFADAISSQSFGFGAVKMYLSRWDPDPTLVGPNKEAIVCQLVMPVENFVRSVAFLEHRLNQMVALGGISQALADDARKFWTENPDQGTSNA
ncbi:MAG: hypothetical protein HY852_22660 [Bradyrhizobium sp.]|uniref:hypothetical protein n=1 Tax=Bradyrhizobium sp. TaxID=376 RepID=UPI0025B95CC0|nr:hypothetical protein [Bradyrhizobium sp.]MBI5264606.1 hypothetical protein [Bradyrhizobium sp.]